MFALVAVVSKVFGWYAIIGRSQGEAKLTCEKGWIRSKSFQVQMTSNDPIYLIWFSWIYDAEHFWFLLSFGWKCSNSNRTKTYRRSGFEYKRQAICRTKISTWRMFKISTLLFDWIQSLARYNAAINHSPRLTLFWPEKCSRNFEHEKSVPLDFFLAVKFWRFYERTITACNH